LPRIEELIATIALNHPIEGFTITGGEPFWQPEALWELLTVIRKYTEDILVYSGYTFDELLRLNSTEINNCLKNIAVLIDGVYIDELNDGSVLRGSSNQMIRILNERYSSLYEQYLSKAANEIQNFMIGNSVISVGIHRKNFAIDLVTAKAQKGLVEEE
jgi:anaerobic ribonucleoside-triphosphate reductase activating protein